MNVEELKKIVKEYVEKGSRCMDECTDADDPGIYNFWDGFHNCALNILRELEEKENKES